MKLSVVSGGFDPIHSGHILYLEAASKLGDKLIVALNSDRWLVNKKGKFFMPFEERKKIIENLQMVNEVIGFDDDHSGSCINALEEIKSQYPDDEIIFCNGGDRNNSNIPEMVVSGIKFEFSVGGDNKANSSSWILKDWQYDYEDRIWGKFYNLFTDDRTKVKELIVSPGKGMSFQRHFHRNEIWYISKGACAVNYSDGEPDESRKINLNTEDFFHVKQGDWHQIINEGSVPCHIIEIQYGDKTSEDDIERLSYYDEKN